MQSYHTIVIGGGISGLSLAHYNARAGHSTLVLEKGNQPGGTFRSQKTERGDFWFELGAHTCYNSYQNLIELVQDCRLATQIQPRAKAPFKMLVGNTLKSIFSQIGLFELLFSVPRLFFLKKDGQTVRSYYGRIVGQGNFARTFSAVFSAVPSQKADDFPADMLFKKRARNKDIAKSFTMQRGLQSIAEAIVDQPQIEFVGGQRVESIRRENDLYHIQTADGTVYQSQHLGLATPPSEASYLLESLFPELAQHLRKIPVAQVESMGVAVARDQIALKTHRRCYPQGRRLLLSRLPRCVPRREIQGFYLPLCTRPARPPGQAPAHRGNSSDKPRRHRMRARKNELRALAPTWPRRMAAGDGPFVGSD